ncbi:MAG: hypothetical protein ABIL76_09475, partial [candidate division WOR-3 bacterium]
MINKLNLNIIFKIQTKKILFLLFLLIFIYNKSYAAPQLFDEPVDNFYVVDGDVLSLVEDSVNKIIYIGGSFTYVGPNTGSGVRINPYNGQLIDMANIKNLKFNGSVYVAIKDNNGGFYVGGDFTKIGNIDR